jgi:FAD/FMN-containing dehydrogenase
MAGRTGTTSSARISGWGRFPAVGTDVITPESLMDAREAMAGGDGVISRGNGRAYGDAAIGARQTLDLTALNRMQSFDPGTGRLTVEAGVLLSDVIAAFAPRGFFPFVVPGTRFVTIGGAIAADIHGKNHHREGGFGEYVDSLVLATPDGHARQISRHVEPELFAATIGGMGLTGTILTATIRLRPIESGWIREHTIVAGNLRAAIAALDAGDAATYSVAWIDCVARGASLGRSLVYVGEHAARHELDEFAARHPFPRPGDPRLTVPLDLPPVALNRWSVSAFNEIYFRRGARKAGPSSLVTAHRFFFPLDSIGDWNRLYGARGFVQHQCVLPPQSGPDILAVMLGRIAARGDASPLAVLKKLGAGSGVLSFPMPGYTLALDFPASRGIVQFLHELDALVIAGGGRLYLAKDACQARHTVEAGYPELARFRAVRHTIDPQRRIRSRLSERLAL